jgi:predicted acyl esterase
MLYPNFNSFAFSNPAFFFSRSFYSSCQTNEDAQFVRDHYAKREVYITMRDGIKLFTAIYEPKDSAQSFPVLMQRTPIPVHHMARIIFRKIWGPTED